MLLQDEDQLSCTPRRRLPRLFTAEVVEAAVDLVDVHSITPYMRTATEATEEGPGTSRAVEGGRA